MGTSGDKIVLLDGMGSGSGSAANGLLSMIPGMFTSLLGGNKMDPNLVAALMNGRNNQDQFGGANGWWLWIIVLFWLWGGRGFGNGFGNGNECCANGLPAQLNNDYGRELLMQAIQGNRSAIDQISNALNCSTSQLQNAICNVQGAIDKVAGQVGMTSQAVINAVQQQGCEIGNQISACCCNLQSAMASGFNNIQHSLDTVGCNIQNAITRQGYENQLAITGQTNVLQNNLTNGFNNVIQSNQAQTQVLAADKMLNADGSKRRWTMEDAKQMFDKCGAKKPDNATWGDIQYLFAMFYSDYFPKVLDCDQKIVKAVLAYLEDPDAPEGTAFVRYLAVRCFVGDTIKWSDMI